MKQNGCSRNCVLNVTGGEDGMGGRRLARSFCRGAAAEGLVNAIFIVIISELQLSPQVDFVPDQHVVKKLPSYRPDQPFHEWMGHRYERDRLDLFDLEEALSQ